MNCRFDLIQPDTLFFWKSNAYVSLSISGSVAASISCMLAKKLYWVQAEDSYIASNFTGVIEYTTTSSLNEWDTKKCSKQAAAEKKLYTYAHGAEKKYSYAHERVNFYLWFNLQFDRLFLLLAILEELFQSKFEVEQARANYLAAKTANSKVLVAFQHFIFDKFS